MTNRIKSLMGLSFLAIVLTVIFHFQMPARANVHGVEKDHGAIVVELFTSEGCSSCLPADALLRQIDGKQTKDGRRIIGLSEHVTYWNHLGWSDPFSNDVYTQRQDEYGRRFQLDSVYTPQMVIDGEEQLVGSDRDGLQRALDKSRQPQPITIQINAVASRGEAVSVKYSLAGSLSRGDTELVAVIVDEEARSTVARGENSGRVLTHVSVARTMKRLAAKTSSEEQSLEIPIPRSSDTPQKPGRRLILFAQEKRQGRILGADEKSF